MFSGLIWAALSPPSWSPQNLWSPSAEIVCQAFHLLFEFMGAEGLELFALAQITSGTFGSKSAWKKLSGQVKDRSE